MSQIQKYFLWTNTAWPYVSEWIEFTHFWRNNWERKTWPQNHSNQWQHVEMPGFVMFSMFLFYIIKIGSAWAHVSAVFSRGLCWSPCWFSARPCERNGQKSHIRSARQACPEAVARTLAESSTAWASVPRCFQTTAGSGFSNICPAKKVSLWKIHSCLHHVIFPAASETLHRCVEVSEETRVTEGCRRSKPLEPVPSKWSWGIYSPPSARFLPTAVRPFPLCCVSRGLEHQSSAFPRLAAVFQVSVGELGAFPSCAGCADRGVSLGAAGPPRAGGSADRPAPTRPPLTRDGGLMAPDPPGQSALLRCS